MNKYAFLLFISVEFCASNAGLAESLSAVSVAKRGERAESWLASRQTTNGAWEPVKHVAISAMVLAGGRSLENKAANRGYDFLLQNSQPDGGFYAGTNYQNYNTSWSLIALSRRQVSSAKLRIQKARSLIVSWQMDLDIKGSQDNPLDGGFGYGDGTPRANLANTLAPLAALYETRAFAGRDEPKFNRAALLDFLHRSQNFAKVNRETYVCEDDENRGGFMYHPGKSFAGEIKLPNGQTGYRSYGSMTYVGLLCYLYAGVDRNAPEVQAAFNWIQRNFTVEENPRMKQEGLFYYYQVMARALAMYGVDEIKTPDGRMVNWREALGSKLLSLQKPDGSWVNPEGRWMEDNPVLCTAYALLALQEITREQAGVAHHAAAESKR
jgi:squalene-hopene/tetraprenyl-beta-curcumene cyclase